MLPSDVIFERTPGTRAEGERIGKLLGVQPWLAAEARKDRLLGCGAPRVLYLATPVWFLPDPKQDIAGNPELKVGSALTNMVETRHENPLCHSFLALAGANARLETGQAIDAGLLTARDISSMDLLRTELVTLSGCETSRADGRTSCGVMGMQRAFLLAGANTLIMSLWQVPDRPRQELLEDFYRRILDGQSRAEALREARLALKAKYPHPLNWGAFICLGNPGPMP